MRKIGVHLSAAGGPARALQRAQDLPINTVQIFLKNNTRWQGPAITEEQRKKFLALNKSHGPWHLFAHAGYLINPAGEGQVLKKSRLALADELSRAAYLGIDYLVLHPGSHVGRGRAEGIRCIVETLDIALDRDKGDTIVLLETTAGQGTSIGHHFEDIAEIIEGSSLSGRLAVCLDTAHIFAAGYDLVKKEACEKTFSAFFKIFNPDMLKLIHLNDSKTACGSRVDRHEHIGKGKIGRKGMKNILTDPRLATVPLVLETPKPEDTSDLDNLQQVFQLSGDNKSASLCKKLIREKNSKFQKKSC